MRFVETPLQSKTAGRTSPGSEPLQTPSLHKTAVSEPLRVAALPAEGITQQKDEKDEEQPDESITPDVPDNKSEETNEDARALEQDLSFLEEDDETPVEAKMMEM